MKTFGIMALAAILTTPMAWAGQTAVTVTQVAGPLTSVVTLDEVAAMTIEAGPDGRLRFILRRGPIRQ